MNLKNISKLQARSNSFGTINLAEDGSYPVTFSSETPGPRPYGTEIVKHDPGCISLKHAANGLPLLWNHDIDRVIGRAEGVRIDPVSKTGKCSIRFFNDEFSQSIKAMVDQGHDCVSYKYWIDDFNVDKDAETVIITKSTVKEISIVGCPFDGTVGVGRSLEDQETIDLTTAIADEPKENEEESEEVKEDTQNTEVITEDITKVSEETTKQDITVNTVTFAKENKTMSNDFNDILALGKFAEKAGVEGEFKALCEPGTKSIDEIKSALVDAINAKQVAIQASKTDEAEQAEVAKSYSIGRAFRAQLSGDWSKAGFEREVQRSRESNQVNYAGGLIVPHEAIKAGNAMNTQTASQGGAFVTPQYAGFVELLRPATITVANGLNVVSGLTQNYQYVQETAAPATYWVSENPGADVTPGMDSLATKTLSPKQLMAQLQFTRSQLQQSPVAFDQFASSKLIREFGIAIDRAVLACDVTAGAFAAPAGAPTGGILLDAGVTSVAVGTNGGNISANVAKVLALKTALNQANSLNGFNPIYVTTPELQGILESTVPPGLTYAASPYWSNGTLSGFKAFSTNSMPKTITKGTSATCCHSVLLGDMSQATLGIFGDIVLNLDPYTLMGQGAYRVVGNQLADVGLTRPAAFAKATDFLAA